MMFFLDFLLKRSKLFYLYLVFLGAASSAMTILIITLINYKIAGKSLPYLPRYDWLLFIIVLLLSYFLSRLFQAYIIRLTNNIYANFELAIFEKIRHCSLRAFEKLGNNRIHTALGDIQALGNLPAAFISVFNALIVIFCCVIYLFCVSITGGVTVLLLMIILLCIYLFRNAAVIKRMNKIRDLQNEYYHYVNDLLSGYRELKTSFFRTENFYNLYLKKICNERRKLKIETASSYMNNELTGRLSWYVVIGMIMYLFPVWYPDSPQEADVYIITILYLIAPVSLVLTLIPNFSSARIAMERLDKFSEAIGEFGDIEGKAAQVADTQNPLDCIRFSNVSFQYNALDDSFMFGPIDMTIGKGEIIFITGGNGSGKSTFVNLVAGLYRPSGGDIYYNDCLLTENNYLQYRNQIGVIFSGHRLFNENYDGFNLTRSNAHLMSLLKDMQIDGSVAIDESENRIDNKLSRGQQKRLLLVYTLLENRDFLVLDEWAAEQDPQFRAFFYEYIIHDLQKMGKTLIIITHDDQYYDFADKIIKFDRGRIVNVKQLTPEERREFG